MFGFNFPNNRQQRQLARLNRPFAIPLPIPQVAIRWRRHAGGEWTYRAVADMTLGEVKDYVAKAKGQKLLVRVKTPFGDSEFEVKGEVLGKKLSEVIGWVDGFLVKEG
jgi:hypothetical protein